MNQTGMQVWCGEQKSRCDSLTWQAYEFTDTLIMILKKNERQISFLHVYHHATTFFPCWYVPAPSPYQQCLAMQHKSVTLLGWGSCDSQP